MTSINLYLPLLLLINRRKASRLKITQMSNQKKWTASVINQTPIVVTANSKREAWEKIKAHRPETKLADVVRFN